MPNLPGPAEFAQPPQRVDLLPIFAKLLEGGTLSAAETSSAFHSLMRGEAHESEVGALLALLATRTPTSDELLGSFDPDRIVDTAGTGGAPKLFNVSTVAAVIAAAAGHGAFAVAKHGNRSRTGRGSAEVLDRLGVDVNCGRAQQARCLEEAHVCFCFAIHHHPATRHVIAARKALRFATIFNLLGPLTNPAGAKRQIMGVYADRFVQPVAEALRDLGSVRAIVIHSRDGFDEISLNAPTRLMHVERGDIREEEIDPQRLGFKTAAVRPAADLDEAAESFLAIIEGRDAGSRMDMAVLNAAATLVVAGGARSFEKGIDLSRAAIASGGAARTLCQLISISKSAPASRAPSS